MFSFTLKYKNQIAAAFKSFYWLLVGVMIVGGYAIYTQSDWYTFFYNLGVNLGRTALVFFCISLLPGMTRRFGMVSPILNALQLIRRYLGISVFMCALTHFTLVKLVGVASGSVPPTLRLFEMMGFTALACLFVLFLTSNDYSVFRLKAWWKRLHRLVYGIAWLLFAHVGLQNPTSIWSVLIGTFAVLEVTSWLYVYYRRNISVSKPTL